MTQEGPKKLTCSKLKFLQKHIKNTNPKLHNIHKTLRQNNSATLQTKHLNFILTSLKACEKGRNYKSVNECTHLMCKTHVHRIFEQP